MLDWELSTLGHPFADLAYQCMQWRFPNAGDFRGLGGLDRAALGIPTEAEYVADYCRRAGLTEVPHWTFLIAFSFFRIAAICQGVYKRALDGNASNPERGAQDGRGGADDGEAGDGDAAPRGKPLSRPSRERGWGEGSSRCRGVADEPSSGASRHLLPQGREKGRGRLGPHAHRHPFGLRRARLVRRRR